MAWPPSTQQNDVIIGRDLFEDFKDPLVASSMKIVTYDEEKGQLKPFEVRKDRETGSWTIPSRSGYPADAVEHMKDAANAFVGLKILEIIRRDQLDQNAIEAGRTLKEGLEKLSRDLPGTIEAVRGLGLMIGVELATPWCEAHAGKEIPRGKRV